MDSKFWSCIEGILDFYGLKPVVGVIPANVGPKQKINNPDPEFWNKVRYWCKKGWAIRYKAMTIAIFQNNEIPIYYDQGLSLQMCL